MTGIKQYPRKMHYLFGLPPYSCMNIPENLFEIAYKKELAGSRRLAKNLGLSAEAALQRTLEAAAGKSSLGDLIAARKREKADAATRIAIRKQARIDAQAHKIAAAQPDPTAWLGWFDGATHPNPGKMGIGGLLKNPDGGVTTISYAAGQGDSSIAEYTALIAVLQAAVEARAGKLVIYGDSRVVIDDVQTENDGAAILNAQRLQARLLMAQLADVSLLWIPRRKNTAADALSQQAVQRTPVGRQP